MPCCPACSKSYRWGDEVCSCGAVLERVTPAPLTSEGLPELEPHGPPPLVTTEFWLIVDGNFDVKFRGQSARQFLIGEQPLLIGRRDPQTFTYPDIDLQGVANFGYTARRHARLQVNGNRLFITDLKGEGTTAVNDPLRTLALEQPCELHDGDCIIIGEAVTFRVAVEQND